MNKQDYFNVNYTCEGELVLSECVLGHPAHTPGKTINLHSDGRTRSFVVSEVWEDKDAADEVYTSITVTVKEVF